MSVSCRVADTRTGTLNGRLGYIQCRNNQFPDCDFCINFLETGPAGGYLDEDEDEPEALCGGI